MAHLSGCYEQMSPRCWTPQSAANTVPAAGLILWPSMAAQMQKVISNCEWCTDHESTCVKAPMQPIIATAPLKLLHIDFMSIEMTMELDQPPNLMNVLVFCNHFMKQIMAYVTPDQTAKTVAKFLWQGYILILRALTKLLSDPGANFDSNIIIKELCDLVGIQKVRTLPCSDNGEVEWAHKTLMQMIRKPSKNQKVDWPKYLPELVHAYNSTRSAITKYNPHYLMFRCQPCLPIDFYFPMVWDMEKHQHVDYYIAELCEWLQEAFKEAQEQSTAEAEKQKQYYDRKANVIFLEPGNLVLAKANAYKGKRKVKDSWEEEPYEVICQVTEGVLSYLVKNEQTVCLQVLHWNWLFPITPAKGTPFCRSCKLSGKGALPPQ